MIKEVDGKRANAGTPTGAQGQTLGGAARARASDSLEVLNLPQRVRPGGIGHGDPAPAPAVRPRWRALLGRRPGP